MLTIGTMLTIGIILLIAGVIVWAVGHAIPNALAERIGIGCVVVGAVLIFLGIVLPLIGVGAGPAVEPTYAALLR